MSEQQKPTSFMQELDQWCDAKVIGPLYSTDPDDEEGWERTVEEIKRAIRAKVLESYRNGQHSGPRPAPQAMRRVAVPQRR